MPVTPNAVNVSVAALSKVASSAQVSPAAAAKTAARRVGGAGPAQRGQQGDSPAEHEPGRQPLLGLRDGPAAGGFSRDEEHRQGQADG
jgi:hypothetical protein